MTISFSPSLLINISTLQHALLSYLWFKVQINVYFSIQPFRMKHLFTLSGPEVIFRHCAPLQRSSTRGCFYTVCLQHCLKKKEKKEFQNLCYASSDQCGNGSNLN